MSKAASPQRGLFSWLTGPRPLSSTDVPDRQLPHRVGGTALGLCCFNFCLSTLGGLKEPSIPPFPGGSSTPFPLPPGRLQLPAPGPLGSGSLGLCFGLVALPLPPFGPEQSQC